MTTMQQMGEAKPRRNPERWIACWKCGREVGHHRDGRPTPHKPYLGAVDWCDAARMDPPPGSPTWPIDHTARHRSKRKAPTEKPTVPANSSRSIPSNIEAWVLHRDGHKCTRCGASDSLDLHHIREWAQGGTHDPDNLDTLCNRCHAEWTWSAMVDDYAEWKRTPPGRWFEMIVAIAHRDTPEGVAMLLRLRKMSALELIDLINARRRAQLGIEGDEP